MNPFEYSFPTEILFGRGRIAELGDRLPVRARRVFIVCDPNVAGKTPALDIVRRSLGDRGVAVFAEVEENPSFETVEEGGRRASAFAADLLLGLGGGSAMDAAKGVALAMACPDRLRAVISGEPPALPLAPIVCLPTTSGTGSEVTPYAVFSDRSIVNKVGFAHPGLYPRLALVDPDLADTMPEKVILHTGLDVVAHAAESFLSAIATPLSDACGLWALSTALESLAGAVRREPEAIERMAAAATVAGLAIASGGTILPHIMGYPLTVFHGVPHGLASVLLLGPVMRFLSRERRIPDKISRIETEFKPWGDVEGYLGALGIPTRLASYGVRQEEIPLFVEKTIVKGDIRITPARVTEAILSELYHSAL